MAVTLKSTKANVRDPQKGAEVPDRYEWQDVEIELQEGPCGWTLETLQRRGRLGQLAVSESGQGRAAARRGTVPRRGRLVTRPGATSSTSMRQGFLDLLRELVPYLETPLFILVVNSEHAVNCWAEAWRVPAGRR